MRRKVIIQSMITILCIMVAVLPGAKIVKAGSIQQNDVWVIENQKVYKISYDGSVLATHYNNQLGEPTTIDATDPFRVTVFYQHHQQIEILDNHGSRIGNIISLSNLNLGEVTHVCRSSRGGLWLYHRETSELLLTNSQISRVIAQFSVLPLAGQTAPNVVTEADGVIYLGFGKVIERFTPYGVRLDPIAIAYEHTFVISHLYIWTINIGFAERRLLSDLSIVESKFKYPVKKNPVIIGSQLYYFANDRLNHSEKIGQ